MDEYPADVDQTCDTHGHRFENGICVDCNAVEHAPDVVKTDAFVALLVYLDILIPNWFLQINIQTKKYF